MFVTYLICFPLEKLEENNDVCKKSFKDEAYHCQAPAFQSSHPCWL